MDTEYSNLDTSANIPLINELTDFLATEAAELAANEDVNDESLTPTNLDALDYKPVSIVHLRNTRNNKIQQKPLMVLFDTGAQKSTVKAKHSHLGKVSKTARPTTFSTPHSKFQTNLMNELQFNMPEFSESKQVQWKFHVLPETTSLPYDMIIGRDLMRKLKMDVLYSSEAIVWDGLRLPMQEVKNNFMDFNAIIEDTTESDSVKEQMKRMNRILDANYEKPDLKAEVAKMTHLTDFQRTLLMALLGKHEALFDGTLGEWKGDPVDIKLKPDATPYHTKAYPIAHIHEATFKKDLDRLESIGVLKKINRSEWAAPAFIIPKKDGRVRFVSDFRRLNKQIKRTPYPLPHIKDMLLKVSHFTYATALDLVMGYYNITLSADASKLCTIVTPFGKYEYLRLPMGVSVAPDIFQEKICDLFHDLEHVRAFIDDLLVVSHGTYEEHIAELDVVLTRLSNAGLKCKIDKCFFAEPEIEYLGYIITKDGIKPNPKKVQGILDMRRPTNKTEVRHFVGMVQYYRDLWPRRSEILLPITNLTKGQKKKGPVDWTPECENAFETIKRLIARDTLLAYPDFNKKFTIHTDASDFQLGAVISQEGKPLAFYSRKLTSAQRNYTTSEKELLSIVETLKEFRSILLGYEVEVFTDHKNLTYEKEQSDSQRLQRWRSLMQEYDLTLKYIEGESNIVADAISRLPKEEHSQPISKEIRDLELCTLLGINELYVTDAAEDCFATNVDDIEFPLAPQLVEVEQKLELNKDDDTALKLKADLSKPDSQWDYRVVEGVSLIHFAKKIHVPKALRQRVLNWYHHYLCHPGGDRLANTLSTICIWTGMVTQARKLGRQCERCQKFKKRTKKYGHLEPKQAETLVPWHTVCVDLIGTYSLTAKVRQPDGTIKNCELKLLCMTFIDPATGWFEIAEVPLYDQSSARISKLFDEVWLSRYPRPTKVLYDNGSEFKKNFQPMLKDFAIQATCTSIKNPQSNAILERIHQVVGSMLKTQDLKEQIFDAWKPWSEILASVAYAIRCSYHSTLQATPGQLVFGRDMLLNIGFEPNYEQVWERKQRRINYDNVRENAKRVNHTYSVGDYAYVLRDGIYRKLEGDKLGPYRVTEVFTNNTVRIQKGIVNERINIRRLTPHFGQPPN